MSSVSTATSFFPYQNTFHTPSKIPASFSFQTSVIPATVDADSTAMEAAHVPIVSSVNIQAFAQSQPIWQFDFNFDLESECLSLPDLDALVSENCDGTENDRTSNRIDLDIEVEDGEEDEEEDMDNDDGDDGDDPMDQQIESEKESVQSVSPPAQPRRQRQQQQQQHRKKALSRSRAPARVDREKAKSGRGTKQQAAKGGKVSSKATIAPESPRVKRKYNRLKPDRSDFAGEMEYQVAFHQWRMHRDRNNQAVRKSRCLNNQRQKDHQEEETE